MHHARQVLCLTRLLPFEFFPLIHRVESLVALVELREDMRLLLDSRSELLVILLVQGIVRLDLFEILSVAELFELA